MSKKNNQLVPACFIVAVILCIAIMFFFIQPAFLEYQEESASKVRTESELQTLSERIEKDKQRRSQEEMNLKVNML